ncbi:MAG: signal peptidase I [Patescibacteria group bacterium]|nr:signal peptidase I [Patescibacteria group bacterium]
MTKIFNKNNLKKISRVLSYAPFAVVIIFSLFILSSKLAIPGGYKFFTVMSGSMEPQIKTGSMVVDKEEGSYRTGDVVTFKIRGGKDTVTHRVVETSSERTSYEVKGDANNAPDSEPVIKSNVIGKVILSIPYLGYLIAFARTMPGLIIFVVIPTTIIIYTELIKIKNEAVRLIAEGKKRKLTTKEKIEEKIGEEIMVVEAEVQEAFGKKKARGKVK